MDLKWKNFVDYLLFGVYELRNFIVFCYGIGGFFFICYWIEFDLFIFKYLEYSVKRWNYKDGVKNEVGRYLS